MSVTDPSSRLVYLITFTTNMEVETKYRYTSHDRALDLDGDIFLSTYIQMELQKQTGLMEDEPIEFIVPTIQPLVDFVNKGSHAPVHVLVEMVDPDDLANTREEVWQGRMIRLLLNPDGQKDHFQVQVCGPKFHVEDRPLGIACTPNCAWRFGDKSCLYDVESVTIDVECTQVDGFRIETTIISTYDANYFARGYIFLGEHRILITESTGSQLTLSKNAPVDWVGKTLRLAPGCDKSFATCRNKWNNERQFGGLGLAIPAENPLGRWQAF